VASSFQFPSRPKLKGIRSIFPSHSLCASQAVHNPTTPHWRGQRRGGCPHIWPKGITPNFQSTVRRFPLPNRWRSGITYSRCTRGTDREKETRPDSEHSDGFPLFMTLESGLSPHYSQTAVTADRSISPRHSHFSLGVNDNYRQSLWRTLTPSAHDGQVSKSKLGGVGGTYAAEPQASVLKTGSPHHRSRKDSQSEWVARPALLS